ncbi:dicarboxylate/amino acid:cation symporter [Anaplasmataceae bacterium AB001_6]|nr:dicarboxylate/amino acid:cation symporter [Anaplasmataceae bacterium AB001_6]
MEKKSANDNVTRNVLLALIAGLLLGSLIGEYAKYFELPAMLFIRALKMIIVPTVFFSITNAIVTNKSGGNILKISAKGIVLYTITSFCAAIIGISFGVLTKNIIPIKIEPSGLSVSNNDSILNTDLSSILLNIIPLNPVKSFANGNLIQIIFFSIIIGFSIRKIKKMEILSKLIYECNNVVMNIVTFIIKLSPIGIFSLITWIVGTQDKTLLVSLARIIMIMVAASIAQFVIVYSTLIIYKRIPYIKFLKGLFPIQIMAFTTTSSNATLPFSIKISTEKLKISKDTANIILPLGATMNMDGLVLFITSTTVLLMHASGLTMGLNEYAVLCISAVLISVGTAGVPNVGLISLSAILGMFSLNIDIFSLFASIDRFRDMISTTVNVSGDVVIAKFLDSDSDTSKSKKIDSH